MMATLLPLQPGELVFYPGQALPSIRSTRMALAQQLLAGKPAHMAPRQLPLLYTLCGRAHGLAAVLAIDAARGIRTQVTDSEYRAIAAETIREHVRRIWLDWPKLTGYVDGHTALAELRGCTLLHDNVDEVLSGASRLWVERVVLGCDAVTWLAHWETQAQDCLVDWTGKATTMPAKLLSSVREAAQALQFSATPLLVHRDIAQLRVVAQHIDDDGWMQAPLPVLSDTGVWTRIALANQGGIEMHDAWLRMGARIADLVRLLISPAPVLSAGAIALSDGKAISWCEMARGLLLHRADLTADERIERYRIAAPTEWNFHPYGVVAHTLAAMGNVTAQQKVQTTGMLAAAFDPCVQYQIGDVYA
jgi:hypothetical protein